MDSLTFTEFEEDIAFDLDDPDFVNANKPLINNTIKRSFKCSFEARGGMDSADRSSYTSRRNATYVDAMTPPDIFSYGVSPMSLASVHPAEMHNGLTHRSQSIGSSLEELHNYLNSSDAVLSIEELRLQLNSCFTCGVSWQDEHVSLDCSECGGYSLERPCPLCDGRCSKNWKRDLTMSHASGKARWEGECALRCKQELTGGLILKSLATDEESRLCSRLEKLGASS